MRKACVRVSVNVWNVFFACTCICVSLRVSVCLWREVCIRYMSVVQNGRVCICVLAGVCVCVCVRLHVYFCICVRVREYKLCFFVCMSVST
jgi:hypothetical protein